MKKKAATLYNLLTNNLNKKNMKKKTILCAIMLAAVANLGYITYDSYRTLSSAGSLVLENIEALTQTEVTKCPDPYDVPNRFIEVKSHSVDVVCSTKGTLTVCGTTFNGSYEKGKKYPFTIAEYNCSGSETGSCCKQSDVRVEVVTGKSA